ncbi:hypothetical protein ES288_A08G295800v1 [Gossypium darwinii]|uniref:RRM domain-containing protein n=1 Tax=Gossypium darwinii TaxID=34276 RepID=A0A5D2FPZ8_GOSDA|nr:hypothetical protein ES288_A08G295800v1 [Gossypium darwinii]
MCLLHQKEIEEVFGFSFVRYGRLEEAKRALWSLDGRWFSNPRLTVSMAKFKPRDALWRKANGRETKVVEGAIDGENLKWLEKCIVGGMRNNATVGLWGDNGIYKIGVKILSGNDLYELKANEWGDVLQVFQKVERWTTKMKD